MTSSLEEGATQGACWRVSSLREEGTTWGYHCDVINNEGEASAENNHCIRLFLVTYLLLVCVASALI